MNIFDYRDYRLYLRKSLQNRGKSGGKLKKDFCKALGIKPAMLSHILRGKRSLSLDQTFLVATFFELSEVEFDYLNLLVQKSKSELANCKRFLDQRLARMSEDELQPVEIEDNNSTASNKDQVQIQGLNTERTNKPSQSIESIEMNSQELGIFYSHWLFAAIRLYCTTQRQGVTADQLSSRFGISRSQILEKLEFLVMTRMLNENSGFYTVGSQSTSLPADSPFLALHHKTWRLDALRKLESLSPHEGMHFSSPLSLSREDFLTLKSLFHTSIQKASQVVSSSKAQDIACLNLDLYWIS